MVCSCNWYGIPKEHLGTAAEEQSIKKHTEVDNIKLMETIYIVELYNLTNRIANINNNRYYWTEKNRTMYDNGMMLLIGDKVI